MKTSRRKKALTYGEFVMAAYDAWGKRRARGVVSLVANAGLVEFRGRRHFVLPERRPD